MTPPVAIAVAVPGATSTAGSTPQATTSALSVSRVGARVARARGIRGAHRKTIDIGAIERRRIDRSDNIGGKHTGERRGKRHGFAAERRKIDARCETPARFLRGDHFKELLLPRGAPHRIEDRSAAPLLRFRVYGHGSHGNPRACCKTFTVGRNNDPAVAARQAQTTDSRRRADPPLPSAQRTGTSSVSPIVDVTLRLSGSMFGVSSTLPPASLATI